ncbi:MAG: M48 family metalloprotease [Halobacteriota archaeon]
MDMHTNLKLRMVAAATVLFGFYLVLAGAAIAVWGEGIWPLLTVATLGFVGFQYVLGKKMALWSIGARDLDQSTSEGARIHQAVERLSREMEIDKPRVMVAEMGVPNAFAVGRKGAGVVVLSTEIIQLLDRDELDGVIAHELSHIRNRDVVMMVIGQSIASMIGMAVYFVTVMGNRNIGAMLVGWMLSMLAQTLVMIFVLAISRYREYVADADAAEAIGRGEPLARALEKLDRSSDGVHVDERVNALCIHGGDRALLERIFSTHPPTEKRVQRLRRY